MKPLLVAVSCLTLCLSAEAQEPSARQRGMASFYGREFHGQTTANGETFSMWQLTAAHPTLPFNTLVRVTNLANGKSVVVRINDSGPFTKNRIIDLSRRAAAELDMVKHGTTEVELEIVGNAEPRDDIAHGSDYVPMQKSSNQPTGFGVQIASYGDSRNLDRKLAELKRKGIVDVYVQQATQRGKTFHRIVIGGFSTRDSAEDHLLTLRQKGINGFVFQIR